MSNQGHSLGVGSYPYAEKQSVYSTVPAKYVFKLNQNIFLDYRVSILLNLIINKI